MRVDQQREDIIRFAYILGMLSGIGLLIVCGSSSVIRPQPAVSSSESNQSRITPQNSIVPRSILSLDRETGGLTAVAKGFPPNDQLGLRLMANAHLVAGPFSCSTGEDGACVLPTGKLSELEVDLTAEKLTLVALSRSHPDLRAYSSPIIVDASGHELAIATVTLPLSPTPTGSPRTSLPSTDPEEPGETGVRPVCTLTPSPTATPEPSPTPSPMPSWTPTQAPSPTPIPNDSRVHGWRGEYFDNPGFSGQPDLIRDDAVLAFDWRKDSPAPGSLPRNLFSIRWSRKVFIEEEGKYTFYLNADDWAVVRINGKRVMTYRSSGDPKVQRFSQQLKEGEELHIEVKFVDYWGPAAIKFWWERATEAPCWLGHYFDNPDLSGAPIAQEMLCGDDNEGLVIRKHWETTDTWPEGLGTGRSFSACWTRAIERTLPTDRYRLCVYAKDSVRLWLDDKLLIPEHSVEAQPVFECRDVSLNPTSSSPHILRLDFYRKSPDAEQQGSPGEAVLGFYMVKNRANCPWSGAHFYNTTLSGPPDFVKVTHNLNVPSTEQGLDARLNDRAFSALWQRELKTSKGIYTFSAESDDGIKLMADSDSLVEDWTDGETRTRRHAYPVAGEEEILSLRVEYYHNNRGAPPRLRVSWAKATPTPTPTCTPTPIPTPFPTLRPSDTPTPIPTCNCFTPTPGEP